MLREKVTGVIRRVKCFIKNKIGGGIILEELVVISGQACSLKCEACGNFSPYQDKKYNYYDYKKIISDLECILGQLGTLKSIQLQGGEFFIHKDYKKILLNLIDNPDIKRIGISTNGTIVPNDQETIELIANDKVNVRLSNYGIINAEYRRQWREVAIENKIEINEYDFNRENEWTDLGRFVEYKSEVEAQETYINCVFRTCFTLENGIIAKCSRATVAHHVQNFVPKKIDFVEVSSTKLAIKVKKFLNNNEHMEACHYCHGSYGKAIKPAVQIEKKV